MILLIPLVQHLLSHDHIVQNLSHWNFPANTERQRLAHIPPTMSSLRARPIYGGLPLIDIRLTQTEDSSDEEASVPFDEDPLDLDAPFDETPKTIDESPWDSLYPEDLPSSGPFRPYLDVRRCPSETCSVCRRPKWPTFVPVTRKPAKSFRRLAGTKWWKRDSPVAVDHIMDSFFEWLDKAAKPSPRLTRQEQIYDDAWMTPPFSWRNAGSLANIFRDLRTEHV